MAITHVGRGPALAALLLAQAATGCITNRIVTIQDDCDTPANVSQTTAVRTAYLWGFVQPKDLHPPCDPRSNHLNGVTVQTTFGHYLLSTVTLGIVIKQRVTWCCAPYRPVGGIGGPPPPPR
jgi:hypothetical protein